MARALYIAAERAGLLTIYISKVLPIFDIDTGCGLKSIVETDIPMLNYDEMVINSRQRSSAFHTPRDNYFTSISSIECNAHTGVSYRGEAVRSPLKLRRFSRWNTNFFVFKCV